MRRELKTEELGATGHKNYHSFIRYFEQIYDRIILARLEIKTGDFLFVCQFVKVLLLRGKVINSICC